MEYWSLGVSLRAIVTAMPLVLHNHKFFANRDEASLGMRLTQIIDIKLKTLFSDRFGQRIKNIKRNTRRMNGSKSIVQSYLVFN